MNIGVFCSANDVDKKYMEPVRELATLFAKNGHAVVYGGSEYGMMKLVADVIQAAGGKVIAVSTEFYKAYVRKSADDIVITKTLAERRVTMLERSDVIVATPGGLGALDELSEVLELKKQNKHNKPVIVLNTDGFYDGLQMQLERMADDGFLPVVEQEGITIKTLDQYIRFVDTPEEVVALIDSHDLHVAESVKARKKVALA